MFKGLIKMEEIIETISFKLQFLNSARFITSSLSNHVNNFTERIQKTK